MTSPRTLKGRLSLHPRGFGFFTAEPDGTGEVKTAFVAPPALNPFLADDLVTATITTGDDGLSTATELTLLDRPRGHVFGEVVSRRGALFVRVDRSVSNTDWPLASDGARAEVGQWVTARVGGQGELHAERVVTTAGDVSLERVMARSGAIGRNSPRSMPSTTRSRIRPATSPAKKR